MPSRPRYRQRRGAKRTDAAGAHAVTGSGHVRELDGLRAVAILLVIPHNADHFDSVDRWNWLPAAVAHLGWTGVQLFFVLSGFLITRNLLDSRGSANYYSTFYGRRALRILPLYVVTLAFFLFLLPHVVTLSPEVLASYAHQGWFWTFLNNWVWNYGREVYWFPHLWSLAIEEQFYLAWPLLVAGLGGRRLLLACIAIVAVAVGARAALWFWGVSPLAIYKFTVCRMDALAVGAIAALTVRSPAAVECVRRHGASALAAACGALTGVALVTHNYDIADPVLVVGGYTLLALAFGTILLLAACPSTVVLVQEAKRLLRWSPLRSVGRVSFAMYLFHKPIAMAWDSTLWPSLATATGPAAPVLYVLAVAVASYGGGLVSYHLLEKHALALKRHLRP